MIVTKASAFKACVLSTALVIGACGVKVTPVTNPIDDLPEPQFSAKTNWLSNDNSIPKNKMLRAAEDTCSVPWGSAEETIPYIGPMGLAGNWFMAFACPASNKANE